MVWLVVLVIVVVCFVVAFIEQNKRVKKLTGKSLFYWWKKGGEK